MRFEVAGRSVHAATGAMAIDRPEVADAPLLGCAILASVGGGLHPDVQTAVDHMVKVARVIEPEPSATLPISRSMRPTRPPTPPYGY